MVPQLLTALRRGTLEYCVLALLRRGRRYGVELVRELGAIEGLVTSEGTLYPLLARLRREQLVTTTWAESPSGPPRRYYQIAPAGRRALRTFTEEWQRYRDAVDTLLDSNDRSTR